MQEHYNNLVLKLHELRNNKQEREIMEEYQDSIHAYSDLAQYFEDSNLSIFYNKKEVLFDSLLRSYTLEPKRLPEKERRNFTLGLFSMALYYSIIENSILRENSVTVHDMEDLSFFCQNRYEDISDIMKGIIECRGEKNVQDFLDFYTYLGIFEEAKTYFGFDKNLEKRKK